MKSKHLVNGLICVITITASTSTFSGKPDKPPKIYEPEVITVECDNSTSSTPVQDALATLNPIGDVNIIQVSGSCDEILIVEDFAKITFYGAPETTFGRIEIYDSGYVSFWNIDLVGPYTNPWEGRAAIKFSSNGQLKIRNMEAFCPVAGGNATGDCIDAVAINGPGKVDLRNFDLIGDWKVGVQTRNVANVTMEGGSISAVEVQIGLRDQSYMQISGTTFTPAMNVHAFERSHIHSFVPIDSALVISSYVVGMKQDGSAYCAGAYSAAMVGGSLDNGANLCE